MAPKSHLTARLDDDLLGELDAVATRLGWSRSQALSAIVRIGLTVVREGSGKAEEVIALAARPPKEPRRRR